MNEEVVIAAPETGDSLPGEEDIAEGVISDAEVDAVTDASIGEDLENTAGVDGEDTVNTVSGGDSVDLSGITALLQDNQQLLQELKEAGSVETMTLWEKPLSMYTPQEGMQLILLIVVLFAFVFALVEGVIKW